jgi:hypothetical protein
LLKEARKEEVEKARAISLEIEDAKPSRAIRAKGVIIKWSPAFDVISFAGEARKEC